ncbi:type I glutamate--ammonia ligase [Alphaproteobacteria bacterium]|nr:type I glutamate--ammonia ligase [Alphaproteobacteria bacterium]
MAQETEAASFDFRFTDSHGTWHHLNYHKNAVDAELLKSGIMFDGSSIAGWKDIDDSDMLLKPIADEACLDPFSQHPSLIVFCNVCETSETPYDRDPRSTAKRAEAYLLSTGIADICNVGPEPEFFVFDTARFDVTPCHSHITLEDEELGESHGPLADPQNTTFHKSHRPLPKGGYFPVAPVDSGTDLRFDMVETLQDMGVFAEKGHHEVAPCQHELGFRYASLTRTGDYLQKYKYAVRNVAQLHGKTATFMPKPLYGDNGSGMHIHLSLAKAGVPLFMGDQYGGLSQEALYFIGGVLKHAQALNAFTNPATNSYKRLVPGFEAPIYKAFSAKNRSAAIRIPHVTNPKARRIEVRFPDPMANPYLATTALLMAGLDGIENKIDPGAPAQTNLYDISPKEFGKENLLCTSLAQALDALDKDRAFLCKGDVFSNDQIDAYLSLKENELMQVMETPSPMEFKLYYSQ